MIDLIIVVLGAALLNQIHTQALTALRSISSLRGEELANTTSLPESLEMTGFRTMVALEFHLRSERKELSVIDEATDLSDTQSPFK